MWIWGKPGKSGPGNFYNQICSTLFTHVCLSSGGRKWVWGQKKRSFFLLQNVALSLALSFGFWTLQRVFDWFDLPIQLYLLQQASELVIDWSIDLQVLFWAVLVFYFEVFIIPVRITSKFLVFGNWFIECRSIMFPLSIYSQYSILGASSSAFNSGQYSILANIRAARGENCKYCQKFLNLR